MNPGLAEIARTADRNSNLREPYRGKRALRTAVKRRLRLIESTDSSRLALALGSSTACKGAFRKDLRTLLGKSGAKIKQLKATHIV